MHEILRRIKNVEKSLNLDGPGMTVLITHYGGDLPSDRTIGNMTIHHVRYDDAGAANIIDDD